MEERDLLLKRSKIALLYLAVPLVLSFSVVDYFFAPDKLSEFFIIRLAIIPISIFCYIILNNQFLITKLPYLPSHIITLFLGTYNAYLVHRTGGDSSAYYAGLNLITIGTMCWIPYSTGQLLVSLATIYCPYFITILFFDTSISMQNLAPNLAFIISTMFIALIMHSFTRRMRFNEIDARMKLNDELINKQKIIEQKTKEAVYLEKLTAQFSENVVQGIKNGTIDLEKKSRKLVTCIFIDIVNSTDRSVKLDHSEYTNVISDFFSECINIFLKNNVTVGTYLGDGIMAFVNAPQEVQDHEQIGFKACIEVLSLYEMKKKYYSDLWRNDFKIRIGINTGYAYIGFFPSQKRGTYTAIGEAVNLTARLCSISKENSICISKNFVLKISEELGNYDLSKVPNSSQIKGFENEKIELFTVSLKQKDIKDSEKCPLCYSPMSIATEFLDTYLLKCTSCSYNDIKDKTVNNKTVNGSTTTKVA